MNIHHVQKNETMVSIAKKYGIPNWSLIFYARCNHRLRQFRPTPESIRPGDVIYIPDNAIVETQKRLESLRKIRTDVDKMFDDILSEYKQEIDRTNRFINNIEITAKIATLAVSLTSFVAQGFKAINLTGAALEAANAKLAKSALEIGFSPLVDVAKETVGEKYFVKDVNDGVVMSVGKDIVHFLLVDMTSPSYYASKVSGIDLKETYEGVKADIEKNRRTALNRLDIQIQKAELQLIQLKRASAGQRPYAY